MTAGEHQPLTAEQLAEIADEARDLLDGLALEEHAPLSPDAQIAIDFARAIVALLAQKEALAEAELRIAILSDAAAPARHAIEYRRALQTIAESYPWEPYEEEEVVRPPGAMPGGGPATNRRIARETLAPSGPAAEAETCRSIRLDDLEPFGNPRVRTKTLVQSDAGGYVSAQVAAVHTHDCPYWREGKRHGPCNCGALEAWEFVYPVAASGVSDTREAGREEDVQEGDDRSAVVIGERPKDYVDVSPEQVALRLAGFQQTLDGKPDLPAYHYYEQLAVAERVIRYLAASHDAVETRLRERITFWNSDAALARDAAMSYEDEGHTDAAVDLHRTANRSTAVANELRSILGDTEPARQATPSSDRSASPVPAVADDHETCEHGCTPSRADARCPAHGVMALLKANEAGPGSRDTKEAGQ